MCCATLKAVLKSIAHFRRLIATGTVSLGLELPPHDTLPSSSTPGFDHIPSPPEPTHTLPDLDEENPIQSPMSQGTMREHTSDNITARNAEFLLMLTEGKQLSQVALDEVIKGCQRICNETLCRVKVEALSALTNAGINSADIPGFDTSFSSFPDPFDKLGTPFMREKFYRERFKYQVRITLYEVDLAAVVATDPLY